MRAVGLALRKPKDGDQIVSCEERVKEWKECGSSVGSARHAVFSHYGDWFDSAATPENVLKLNTESSDGRLHQRPD